MRITPARIQQFQELYRESFGCEISPEEALQLGSGLIGLVSAFRRLEEMNMKTKIRGHGTPKTSK